MYERGVGASKGGMLEKARDAGLFRKYDVRAISESGKVFSVCTRVIVRVTTPASSPIADLATHTWLAWSFLSNVCVFF